MKDKYRGKLTAIGDESDNDMVFGSLIRNKGKAYIVPEYANIEHEDEDVYSIQGLLEVHPDTVGQFSGLKDKNGTDGFAGDIAILPNGDRYEVKWDNESARFFLFGGVLCKDIRLIANMEITGTVHDKDKQ